METGMQSNGILQEILGVLKEAGILTIEGLLCVRVCSRSISRGYR